jgi:hypothetical protein
LKTYGSRGSSVGKTLLVFTTARGMILGAVGSGIAVGVSIMLQAIEIMIRIVNKEIIIIFLVFIFNLLITTLYLHPL